MARMAIFLGLRSYESDRLIAKNLNLGDSVQTGFLFDKGIDRLSGTVVYRNIEKNCGQLIVLRNQEYQNRGYTCSGWKYIPLWLSECGQSGILATWKEQPGIPYLRKLLEVLELCDESDVANCMAL